MREEFYHSGHRSLQESNDSVRIADQLYASRRRDSFTQSDAAIINNSSSFFLATATATACPDCSIKSGIPGFIQVVNEKELQFPDYDGNGMYRSLGNILVNPNVGLLFVQFDGDQLKLRVNGKAKIIDDLEVLSMYPGAKLVVSVEPVDIFPNCPRYTPRLLKESDSEFSPKLNYITPEPFWKSKIDLRPYLPKRSKQHER